MKDLRESKELLMYRKLNARKNLNAEEAAHHLNLEKGFEGEKQFEAWLKLHQGNGIILSDLLLETNQTTYQIDSLYLSPQKIYLFEVKNFEGDYHLDKDKWLSPVKKEVKNPLLQLSRNETLFRILLQEHHFQLPIEAILVFINPHFHLYQASSSHPIIFHSQLDRFAKTLKKNSATPLKAIHSKLAKKLLALHQEESRFERLPGYEYEELEKGVGCRFCGVLYASFANPNFRCSNCKTAEAYVPAILRAIEEYQFLFPQRKMTVEEIWEWCHIVKSKKTIRKILNTHFLQTGIGKATHYVPREK
ncbi:nuclease-related domain-containing protein [Metabacillus indicus]|uniref:nuclease-related domain-containing protein n=1 Tax=Metabacillus indicus TaxID=246786 RepID=UPI00248FDEBA|nr:nuclease-related domain-containing protein [Metabacillus indicus]